VTTSDLLRDALLELGVVDPVETVPSDMQSLALVRWNAILDQWNAQQIATYTKTFPTFTITANLSPHTIGPTGATWTVTQRPVALIGVNLLIGSGVSLVRIPITIRDDAWWMAQPVPNVRSSVPTDVYYSPAWPNGSIYFWPVPNTAYVVELEVRYVLAQVADADLGSTVTWPPGYQRALTLTLAEDLTGPYTVPMPQGLGKKAQEARAVVFANNNAPVRIRTRQSGMPSGTSGGYSWRSGVGGGR